MARPKGGDRLRHFPVVLETPALQKEKVGLANRIGWLGGSWCLEEMAPTRTSAADMNLTHADCGIFAPARWVSGRLSAYIAVMPVDQALLDILVCPVCKTPVRLVKDGRGSSLRHVPANLSNQGRHSGDADR
jgi:hypothetical protein